MIPGVRNWKWNYSNLLLVIKFFKIESVITRGVFANFLALKLRDSQHINKVVFDARGAYAAEWREFNFGVSESFVSKVFKLEEQAIKKSDFRISVSNQLIDYWEKAYNYKGNIHVDYEIIPCTLSSQFLNVNINDALTRKELNIPEQVVVLVYSGSASGWQSIDSWINYLEQLLNKNEDVFVLFLTEKNENIDKFIRKHKFAKQIFVTPDLVPQYLSIADYGLLIRDENITNKVSSPVKFSEYLSCGLDVIISKHIGDYSSFVKDEKCGIVLENYSDLSTIFLSKKTIEDKLKNKNIALKYFEKGVYKNEYLNVLSKLKV